MAVKKPIYIEGAEMKFIVPFSGSFFTKKPFSLVTETSSRCNPLHPHESNMGACRCSFIRKQISRLLKMCGQFRATQTRLL
jgi:hypothetical protein